MGRGRKKQDKEGIAEECCFTCKDGGDDLRVCDFKNCLKAYHPSCVGKEDSFLSSDEKFVCDWHICLNCRGNSDYQCLCCPLYSVCHACLGKVEFVQLRKKNKGLCRICLDQAIRIEKNADADAGPDVAETDHRDAEIATILFKDYWEVIKDREHLTLVDLEEFSVFLNRRLNSKEVDSEKFPDDGHKSDENILAGNGANDQTIPFQSMKKQNKVNTSLKNKKSNKKKYVGWGSEELIEFLSSFGKDTAKPLDEQEIVGLVKGYIKQKNLYQDNKKLSFLCDDKLQPLFTRRKVRCKMIRRFLAIHLASNAVSEDEIFDGSEDDDTPIMKRKPQKGSLEFKIAKRVSERNKRCFALLIQNNINLIYLRRTLVVSLLSHPDTFEQKIVGCFVRLKNVFKEHCYQISRKAFLLGLVTGIKKSSEEYKINGTHTNILLCVTGALDDVKISMLSDEDFQEEECDDLISLVNAGLLERATVAEFKEKVATVHTDIVNHWIERELVRLERGIDRAQMKGLHAEMEELLHRKELLSKPAERQRRLEEVPEIVPDTEYEEKEAELEAAPNNEAELEVAANNSSQGNRGKTRGRVYFMDVDENCEGAAQHVSNSLNDLEEEIPEGAAEDVVECLKVLEEKPPEGATEQMPDSLSLLNKESSEVASKQGDATLEALSEAHEACFSGVPLDPALHSQMHSTQDDSPTQAMDIDQEESDHTRQVAMTRIEGVEVINLDSDEDEDLPMGQHNKPEGKAMHARPMNGGNFHIERSKSASPSTLHVQGDVNGDVRLEQHEPAPATMSVVPQPEVRQPAPTPMSRVLPPEKREQAPAAKNGVLPLASLWHYVDPQGDARGPFPLLHLWHWKQNGFFDEDFRVWRTGQTVEQAILLTDAIRMHL